MRILAIGDPEVAENTRLAQEATPAGVEIEIVPMEAITFDFRENIRVNIRDRGNLNDFDVLYLRSFYPHISEGLLLAEYAHKTGLRVIDGVLATGNFVQSKMYDVWRLREEGLPVPQSTQSLGRKEAAPKTPDGPLVIKGVHGSQGRHVFRADEATRVQRLREEYGPSFFVEQELLEISAEYRVITVGYRPLGVMEKIRSEDDFRHNISVGAEGKSADLPKDLLRLCADASKTLKHEFAGVDLAMIDDRPCIIEVNRSPGFVNFEKVTGKNVAREFLEYAAASR